MASSSNQLNSAGSVGGVQITQTISPGVWAIIAGAAIASLAAIILALRRK